MRRIRETRADRMVRYEALSRSWCRYFKYVFVPKRELVAPLIWFQTSEPQSLGFYQRFPRETIAIAQDLLTECDVTDEFIQWRQRAYRP